MILYAAYASLAYLIVYFVEVYFTVYQPGSYVLPVHALEVLLSIVVYAGWIETGRRFKNHLLERVSLVAIFLVPLFGILNAVLDYLGAMPLSYAVLSVLVSGMIVTVFGVSLLRLKKRFGDIARVTGVLDIIAGVCLLSIILSPIAAVLMPPVLILEAFLLFKAYKKTVRSGKLSIFHKIF